MNNKPSLPPKGENMKVNNIGLKKKKNRWDLLAITYTLIIIACFVVLKERAVILKQEKVIDQQATKINKYENQMTGLQRVLNGIDEPQSVAQEYLKLIWED